MGLLQENSYWITAGTLNLKPEKSDELFEQELGHIPSISDVQIIISCAIAYTNREDQELAEVRIGEILDKIKVSLPAETRDNFQKVINSSLYPGAEVGSKVDKNSIE